MGVKHFFIWLNNNFKNCIKEIPLKTPVLDVTINNLCIDLNGVFHPCAQQVYEYGDYKRKERLLKVAKKRKFTLKHQMLVFQKVCQRIDYYRLMELLVLLKCLNNDNVDTKVQKREILTLTPIV